MKQANKFTREMNELLLSIQILNEFLQLNIGNLFVQQILLLTNPNEANSKDDFTLI